LLTISTWGLPKYWAKVKYVKEELPQELRVEKGKEELLRKLRDEVESSTPLALFEGWKKVVLLSVTLADYEVEGHLDPNVAIKTVEEAIKNKDEEIKKVFKEATKLVIAGSGKFGKNKYLKSFEIPFSNVVSSIALKLFKVLMDERSEIVFLDITHGMNYHPLATYTALKNYLLKFLATALGKKVTFASGSSDPYVRDEEGPQVLTYHVLEVEGVEPDLKALASVAGGLGGKFALKVGERFVPVKVPGELHELKGLVTKLRYPSPLYWSYVLTKLANAEADVERVVSDLSEKIDEYEVIGNVVRAKYVFDEKSLFALLAIATVKGLAKPYGELKEKLYLTTLEKVKELEKYLESSLERPIVVKEENKLRESLRKVEFSERLEATKKVVRELRETGLGKTNLDEKLKEKLKGISFNEIEEALEVLERDLLSENLLPYSFLRAEGDEALARSALWWAVAYSKEPTEEDVRNFIAHAGMEQNVTVVGKGGRIGYYLPLLGKLEREMKL